MPDYTPVEIVLDYRDDKVTIDGTELPVALSSIGAKAVTEGGRATVTLTFEVDQVRSVAALPQKDDAAPTAPPTPEQGFEDRLDALRNHARR
ncbi:hypothetical protein [Gordonia soli]|uniref:Uncharacterized protein n=1 Tax=Gordonia soli NBRC 108243 TaxID=1223545 RepID=M0QR08_9ACTN|nr:hypothetical protein [Gordonia soli]GAC71028.1 hypothetical protein GS4_47_00180 [Gordonia soli NBRC 108243]